MRYEEPGAARFQTGQDAEGAWLRIPVQRNWFVLLFIGVWLSGWTFGGIMAIAALMERFEPFLVFWLCGWAIGWVFAAVMVLWQIGGAEILRIARGDLEYRVQFPGFVRRRGFHGGEIRNVAASPVPAMGVNRFNGFPPLFNTGRGSVRFTYGGRSIYLASGLDEAEGALVAGWMTERLPLAARG